MRIRLTPAFAAKATIEPGAKRTTYWDSGMPGFGLMVTANRHRSYVVQYRSAGQTRRMHLKNGLTLTAARREAKAILALLWQISFTLLFAANPFSAVRTSLRW